PARDASGRRRDARLAAVPELPEVEHITRYVRERVVGRRIASARVLDAKLVATSPSPLEDLRGRTIHTVERRGKLIVLGLDDGAALVVHLKLTGKLWHDARPPGDDLPRWTRLALALDDGGAVRVEDMRRFAWVRLLPDAAALEGLLA